MEGIGAKAVSEPSVRPGRRRSTSQHELEAVAFELFEREGFDATTVDAIAKSAGIGRRTFFRYFESKNDVVWGSFTEQLDHMRERFAQRPADEPLMESVRAVVVEFNRVDPAEVPKHRRRMELILRVPALQAHSTLRYGDWRAVVAEYAAKRLGEKPAALRPQAIAYAALGVSLAAYEHWLAETDLQLCDVLDEALSELARGFVLG
ncbi:mycofactocin system transcriptional regulator [Prauserella endophytica]|uniref:Mycofactocin system transcriptional regulator n=1 Tax=Prauserella endophytica TaxID=1592324 RepID=A0ABY2S7K7_9PSEU|nr:mycofactocin system transcriptional regulator [Prauserella endophytica]PXY25988.1 mycofactocin system transcriptional regulator [Prauserella coralliicola]TKG71872.1 mycofactocin system transcriptional regulator [Prauserella endophytica]